MKKSKAPSKSAVAQPKRTTPVAAEASLINGEFILSGELAKRFENAAIRKGRQPTEMFIEAIAASIGAPVCFAELVTVKLDLDTDNWLRKHADGLRMTPGTVIAQMLEARKLDLEKKRGAR